MVVSGARRRASPSGSRVPSEPSGLHDHAGCASFPMARVGIVGASGYTGAELLRLAAGHPELEVVLATGDTQAGTPVADALPEPGRRLPGPGLHAVRRRRVSPASTSCSSACPTAPARRIVPELRRQGRPPRRPGRRLPAEGPGAVPAVVRRGPHRPRAAGRLRLRPARAVPGRDPRRRATWPRPGCYPTAAALALAPLVRAGRGRADRHRRRRRLAACPAPAGRPSRTPRSARSTRTSPPTGCSTTGTRPRSSRRPARRSLFTPHLAPMNRGILATCYARPDGRRPPPTTLLDLLRAAYAGRAVRGRERRRRRRPRPRSGSNSRPRHRPVSTSAPAGSWRSAPSTTSPRARRARPCSAPTSLLGLPETTGLPIVGVYP